MLESSKYVCQIQLVNRRTVSWLQEHDRSVDEVSQLTMCGALFFVSNWISRQKTNKNIVSSVVRACETLIFRCLHFHFI